MLRASICRKSVSVYADDVTIILTKMEQLRRAREAIKDYETMAGAKINRGKSVDLQRDTWRGKSMPTDSAGVFRDLDGFGPPNKEERG